MDVQAILTAVGSIGVPGVMCFMLFQYMREDSRQTRDAITELKVAIVTLTERLKKGDE